jgi:predicted solute-binding protein
MLGVRKQEVSSVNIDDARRLKQLRRRIRLTVQSVTSDVLTRMLEESE